jgi:thiol:disulfide interchange protein
MKVVVDLEEFKQIIATGTVVVDYYADWCGPYVLHL